MTRKPDPLDIEWWESPVSGRVDWELLTLPIGALLIVAVALAWVLLR